jgi:hypothetical protein
MTNAKRLLAPHVLVLQMLISRFQAARYRRPGLMLLIQRLVLISARAHRYMRLVSSLHSLVRVLMFSSLTAHTPWPAKPVFRSCYLDSRLSDVRAWMRTARTRCGTPCTLPHSLGFPFDHCELSRILCQGVAELIELHPGGRMARTRFNYILT